MLPEKQSSRTILWLEVLGFGAIIILSWLNELCGLPRMLFSRESTANWHESILETAITMLVAVPVVLMTWRVTARLHRVEGFLHLCAWCKKVCHEGQWVPMEEFVMRRLQVQTSHSMCQTCLERNMKSIG